MDYGFWYLLSGTGAYLTDYTSGMNPQYAGQNALDTINFFWGGFPAGLWNNASVVAEMYDFMFPSLTPTQRGQYEAFLKNAVSYFYYAKTNDPSGSGLGSGAGASRPNRVAISQGGGGICLLALYSSLQSYRGYSTPSTYVTGTAQSLLTAVDTQLITWATYTWMADGGYVEGILYATYGTTAYAAYSRARINTNNLVGNSPPTPVSTQRTTNILRTSGNPCGMAMRGPRSTILSHSASVTFAR